MKYLIAVLLSATFVVLVVHNAPALTKKVVHKALAAKPTVKVDKTTATTTKAVQPKPEQKVTASQPITAPAPKPKAIETSYASGCETYRSTFALYWSGYNLDTALAICQAESGGNPYAVSSTNDYGLMQLHDEEIFNPSANIAGAYRKYLTQGWEAWTTYNTGAYAQFL